MRYLGNKSKLLNEIETLLKDKHIYQEGLVFCDAFSGTASVGNYFKHQFNVISNDSLTLSFVLTDAKLNAQKEMFKNLKFDPFDYFNQLQTYIDTGFVYNNYAPKGGRQYFSDENAKIIDTIRITIDLWEQEGKINETEKNFLVASLIESASKVANIAGVYGAYLKKWDPRAIKKMVYFPVETTPATRLAQIHNESISSLIQRIQGDILYMDPPYTSTQYSTQYHVLETIAKNDKPLVKGITGQRDMSHVSSAFCKNNDVHVTFEQLIAHANFKHLILSYSCDGIMSKEFIEAIFKRYGKPETYELRKIGYKRYKNSVAQDNEKHQEYIFYIEKKDKKDISFASPLNYQGGKHDLIPFIKGNLPIQFNTFYDLFGGGLNVGANIDCEHIIYNDINFKVKELLEQINNTDPTQLLAYLQRTIKKYNLKPNDKVSYAALRTKYNKTKDFRDLYLLTVFGFQHQIRFNSSYEFNNPVGLGYFNESLQEKLLTFKTALNSKNIDFHSEHYSFFEPYIQKNDLIYCDPPYLITLGSYNDGKRGFNGWDETQEKELLSFLDRVHQKGAKFLLSNVINHRGTTNHILQSWINKNQYILIQHPGKTRGGREEILVRNY